MQQEQNQLQFYMLSDSGVGRRYDLEISKKHFRIPMLVKIVDDNYIASEIWGFKDAARKFISVQR